jgi:hypothetical protein
MQKRYLSDLCSDSLEAKPKLINHKYKPSESKIQHEDKLKLAQASSTCRNLNN